MNVNIKNDRIDMLFNKDLKDSIKQVAYNNGYTSITLSKSYDYE